MRRNEALGRLASSSVNSNTITGRFCGQICRHWYSPHNAVRVSASGFQHTQSTRLHADGVHSLPVKGKWTVWSTRRRGSTFEIFERESLPILPIILISCTHNSRQKDQESSPLIRSLTFRSKSADEWMAKLEMMIWKSLQNSAFNEKFSFFFRKEALYRSQKKNTKFMLWTHRISTYSMKANRKFGEKSSCAIEFCARSNRPQRTISNRTKQVRECSASYWRSAAIARTRRIRERRSLTAAFDAIWRWIKHLEEHI